MKMKLFIYYFNIFILFMFNLCSTLEVKKKGHKEGKDSSPSGDSLLYYN